MLAVWQATIIDANGKPTTGASIEVRDEEFSNLATLYEDTEGTIIKDNPFVNTEPFTRFFLADGEYKIKATKDGQETEWRNVQISRFLLDITPFGKDFILLDDAGEARDTLEVYSKTEMLDVQYPVGSTYVQYATVEDNDPDEAMPSDLAPDELYGGTWALLYDDEGIDFHTEGYDTTTDGASANRTDGLQLDNMQRITGTGTNNWAISASSHGTGVFSGTGPGSSVRISPTGSSGYRADFNSANSPDARVSQTTEGRTTDRNRWMRLWQRTA